MSYLLDTNACVALINGRPEAVRDRFESAVAAGEGVFTSAIVVFELWYGVAESTRREPNKTRVSALLAGALELIDFDREDAHLAGRVRAQLEGSANRSARMTC